MINRNDASKSLLPSLTGLAVGDAFGQQYMWHVEDIAIRREDVPIWRWTDDTEMAMSVASVLMDRGVVDQSVLASRFAEYFDSTRGYGSAMLFELLPKLQHGADWRQAAPALFEGRGSYGNGAAMRVAPLGAFYSNDMPQVVARPHSLRKSHTLTPKGSRERSQWPLPPQSPHNRGLGRQSLGLARS